MRYRHVSSKVHFVLVHVSTQAFIALAFSHILSETQGCCYSYKSCKRTQTSTDKKLKSHKGSNNRKRNCETQKLEEHGCLASPCRQPDAKSNIVRHSIRIVQMTNATRGCSTSHAHEAEGSKVPVHQGAVGNVS